MSAARRQRQFASKYSSYKKYTASTEVSYTSHSSRSSIRTESATDYQSAKGTAASSREITSATETRSLPVYIAIQDYTPDENDKDSIPLEQGQIVEVLDNKNNTSWLVRTKARPPRTGWVPGSYFETPSEYYKQRRRTREIEQGDLKLTEQQEALIKRDAVYADLLKSEEDFVADLKHVLDNYVTVFDDAQTPATVRHQRDAIVLNLRELYNFHANVLLKGLQYYADDPGKVGQTFVRLERDFDHHVRYCQQLTNTEKLLTEDSNLKQFFDQISEERESGSGMKLIDYLNRIRSRMQQYQIFFKEFIKYTSRAQQSTKSMQKALELMLSVPQRATDLAYIRNVQHYSGDILKLGRLLRHEQFEVWEGGEEPAVGAGKKLYLFLFKARLMFTEKNEPEDPDEELPDFGHVATIHLDQYEVTESSTAEDVFVMRPLDPNQTIYSIRAVDKAAGAEFARQAWVKDIADTKQAIVAEAAAAATGGDADAGATSATTLVTEFVDVSDLRSEFSEYSTTSRKSSMQQMGPDEGPPAKKVKSPPMISPSASSQSLYSGSSGEFTTTATTIDMQGTRVTRTQYGFRSVQESAAKMCLKVTGYPLPEITWYKDGELLKESSGRHAFYADDDGFFSLSIDPVKVADTGRYSCVASNEYGKATTSAFFRVLKVEKEAEAPKFVTPLRDIEIQEGENVSLECDVEGWPEPELVWLVDGSELHPSHDFRLEYDGQKATLHINDVQPEDSGVYTVKIKNDYGVTESAAELRVDSDPDKCRVAPEVQQRIVDVDCDEGDDVRFKAVMTGDPPPETVWYINGVPLTESEKVKMINEDGIYILTIKDVTKHFDGDVVLSGVNRLGEDQTAARLTVRCKPIGPRFDKGLQDKTVNTGDKIQFDVQAAGFPEPTVNWFLQGRRITPNDDGVTLSFRDGGYYRFEMLNASQPEHQGEIKCVAENEHGRAETSAQLSVLVPGEKPTPFLKCDQPLRDVEVAQGETTTLEAKFSGFPKPSVAWYVNGNEVADSTAIPITASDDGSTHRLTLTDMCADTDVSCIARNEVGVAETANKVTITKPIEKDEGKAPVFVKQPSDQTLESVGGALAVFEAEVEGSPSPTINWFLDGERLAPSDDVEINEHNGHSTLTISHAVKDGQLVCRGENSLGTAECAAKLTIKPSPTTKPKFLVSLKDVTAAEGEPARFEAQFDGAMPDKVEWLLNGRPIGPGDGAQTDTDAAGLNATLLLPKVTKDMAGTVTCRATNEPNETAESSAKLTVTPLPATKPKFLVSLKDVSATEGEPARFEAEFDGAMPDKVEWLLNGRPIGPDDGAQTDIDAAALNATLLLPKVTKDMAGTVTCRATNEPNETAESSAKLTVTAPPAKKPKFLVLLEDVSATEGEPARFEAEFDGAMPDKVEWLLNGRLIGPADGAQTDTDAAGLNATLLLPKVTKDMAGTVTCRATNEPNETAESSAKLTVTPLPATKPKFLVSLKDVSATEGEPARFEAEFDGAMPDKVEWLLNGQSIGPDDGAQTDTDVAGLNATLLLPKVTKDMAGTVTCRATNEPNETAESSAKLTVKQKSEPPTFDQKPEDQSVPKGTAAVFKAVVKGLPAPTVKWFLNGAAVTTGVSASGDESTLTVSDPPDDGAVVKCVAENAAGTAEAIAQLSIQPPTDTLPVFDKTLPEQLQCVEGDTLVAEVGFTGSPPPKITWYSNGKKLADNGRSVRISTDDTTSRLELTKVTPTEQNGELKCVAENDAGRAETAAVVDVEPAGEPPVFVRPLADQMTTEKDVVMLEAKISGVPMPTEVSWTMDGVALATGENNVSLSFNQETGVAKMQIIDAKESHSGTVVCRASNRNGTAESTSHVIVQKRKPQHKPQFMTPLSAINLNEGDTLRTKVMITGDPAPKVKWTINDRIVVETEDVEMSAENGVYALVIHGVSTDMTGTIKCTAFNKMGEVSTTAPITVVAPVPVEFETCLSDATCREGDTLKLKAVLLGEPTPVVTWFINDVELKDGHDRIKTHGDHGTYTVTISDITLGFSGTVLCKAVNEYGEASSSAKLLVLPRGEPPDFLQWLSNVAAKPGDVVEHKVVFTGDPTPTLTWYINNVKVKPAADGGDPDVKLRLDGNVCVLTVTSFAERHVGDIICKAENDAGEVSCTAHMQLLTEAMELEGEDEEDAMAEELMDLDDAATETALSLTDELPVDQQEEMIRTPTPIQAPKFIDRLKDTKVKKGQQAIFECFVPETKGVVVKWLKDGKEIELIARIRMGVHHDPSAAKVKHQLVIDETCQDDVGTYSVVISNAVGQEHCEAKLELIPEAEIAPEFTERLTDTEVIEGESLELHCCVIGQPVPSVQWYFNDIQIKTSETTGVRIETSVEKHSLSIKSTSIREHSGTVKCVATNTKGSVETTAKVTVTKATKRPEFVQKLTKKTVKKSKTVVMECRLCAGVAPEPTVKWFKDDREIEATASRLITFDSESGLARLEIKSADNASAGLYRCEATNAAGQDSTEAPLEVTAAPLFLDQLHALTVTEGETGVFSCVVSGVPQPTVKWYKSGQELVADGTRIQITSSFPDGQLTLTIKQTSMTDAADYTVLVKNDLGTADSDAALKVVASGKSPVFTTELTECQVKVDETVTMECVVEGVPTPEVKWLKDGTEVLLDRELSQRVVIETLEQGRLRLTIQHATAEDVGHYKCEAWNKIGQAKTEANLHVQFAEQIVEEKLEEKAPEFVEQLKECFVNETEVAVFECKVAGSPTPEVVWLKDNKPIAATDPHLTIEQLDDGTQKLNIEKAVAEDVGHYTCQAVNKVGTSSTEADLHVKYAEQREIAEEKAPEFTSPLKECFVNETDVAVFECKVAGSPMPEIIWLKDDKPIASNDPHLVIEQLDDGTQKLKIGEAVAEDVGHYTCQAVNKAGKSSTEADLHVKYAEQKEITEEKAPEFTNPLQECFVNETEVAVFECKVTGSPTPEIIWFKDDKPIAATDPHLVIEKLDDGTQKLVIGKAVAEDVGHYTCQAVNKAGKSSTEADLHVKYAEQREITEEKAPEFTNPLQECFVNETEVAVFECKVTGSPTPEIIWFKDDKPIAATDPHLVIEKLDDGTQKLVIGKAVAEDVGHYTCQAVNKAGKSSSEADLHVKYAEQSEIAEEKAPEFTNPLHECFVNETEVAVFECKVTGSPKPEIIWFKDDKPIATTDPHLVIEKLDDGTQKLVIEKAVTEDVGHYTCQAVNKAGKSSTEADLHVKYAEQREITEEKAPEFTNPLQECFVNETEVAVFECKVTGSPTPEIIWFKDDKPIAATDPHLVIEKLDDGTQKLVIGKAVAEDVGHYTCQAVNKAGKSSSEADLHVKYAEQSEIAEEKAPEFTNPLKECFVEETSVAVLECKAVGSPAPQIQWFKDDKPISPADQHLLIETLDDGTQRLKVDHAAVDDVGHYRCEAVNVVGKAKTEAELHVRQAEEKMEVVDAEEIEEMPKFVVPLTEGQVTENETVQMECVVEGTKVEIHWFKDGKQIEPDGQHVVLEELVGGRLKLTIQKATLEDVGSYKCEAVNKAGKAETVAKLDVKFAEEKMEVTEAQEALEVPRFVIPLDECHVTENQTAQLECVVKGAQVEVHWFKDGKPVEPDGQHMVVEELTDGRLKLVIHQATTEDVGSYKCEAVNRAGKAETEAKVDVQFAEEKMEVLEAGEALEAPKFIVPLTQCQISENETAALECVVSGADVEVHWFKDGKRVEPDGQHMIVEELADGHHKLLIQHTTSSDVGSYRCEAVNKAGKAETEAKLDIKYAQQAEEMVHEERAPEFTRPLEGQTVPAGVIVKLECAVEGDPTPEVKWLKNGDPLAADGCLVSTESDLETGEQKLLILEVRPVDTAVYRCEASSPAGTAFTEAMLHVLEGTTPVSVEHVAESAPEFVKVLHAADVAESEEAVFECEVKGSPKPDIRWLRSGEPIVQGNGSKYVIESKNGTQILRVKKVTKEDVAEYRCEASNKVGAAWTEGPLTIKSPTLEGSGSAPDFAEPLKAVEVEEGGTAVFECKVTGEPKPEIRWLKDGVPIETGDKRIKLESIPDEGVERLTLLGAKPADVGLFLCEATNALGVVWSDATLGVIKEYPPEFVRELAPQTVDEGESAAFDCQVTGVPTPEIRWSRDGVALTPEQCRLEAITVAPPTADGVHKLVIAKAKVDHQGNYKAEAFNSAGSLSSNAPLTVQAEEPPVFTKGLKDAKVDKGATLTLSAQVEGKPKSIKWYKAGAELKPDGNRIRVTTDDDGSCQLVITDCRESDAGQYSVEATNDAGSASSKANVDVILPEEPTEAPTFKKGPTAQNVPSGATLKLDVEVDGKPKAVKWYKAGNELNPAKDKRIKIRDKGDGKYELEISDATPEDAGLYSVEALNDGGSAKAEAPVEVQEPLAVPAFKKGLVGQNIPVGATLKLDVEVEGKPKSVKWYKAGKEVTPTTDKRIKISDNGDGKYQLELSDATPDDAGVYSVVAANDAGSANSEAPIKVEEPVKTPTFKKGLVGQQVPMGATLKLDVEVEGKPKSVKWYKAGNELSPESDKRLKLRDKGNGKYELELTDATPEDAGVYSVEAVNDAGNATSEAPMEVQVPFFAKKLQDQSVEEGDDCTFSVDVGGLPEGAAPKVVVKWYRNGKELRPDDRVVMRGRGPATHQLRIADVHEGDVAADYTAKLQSADTGETFDEASAALTVRLPPLQIRRKLEDQTIDEGQPLELTVAVNGKPKVVKWYRNGKELTPKSGDGVEMKERPDVGAFSLVIPSSNQEEHAGTYRVTLANDTNEVFSEATININPPPKPREKAKEEAWVAARIVIPLKDDSVEEDDAISLKAKVEGTPFPDIQWLKNDQELPVDGAKYTTKTLLDGTVQLRIQNASKDDDAAYTLAIRNDTGEDSCKCKVEVTERKPEVLAPKFVIPLSSTSATDGKPITFDVKVRGLPAPTLSWLKDGVRLDDDETMRGRVTVEDMSDGRWKLTIADVRSTDAGQYTCVAENTAGSVSCDATLSVKPGRDRRRAGDDNYPPKFNVPLRDRRIPEHQHMTIECHVDAKPKAEIQWSKDGDVIVESDRIEIQNTSDGKCRLVIKDFTADLDAACYKCLATNELGNADTRAYLKAEAEKVAEEGDKEGYAPRFVEPLSDERTTVGKKGLILRCKVDASPRADIKWYKDGMPVRNETHTRLSYDDDGVCTLTIDEIVDDTDGGSYRCVAGNYLGTTNTASSVTVARGERQLAKKEGEEPIFTKGLADLWVERGSEDIILSCTVTGDPMPEIRWYKDGTLLRPTAARLHLDNQPNGVCVLHVKECTMSDEGVYRCEAQNQYGRAVTMATVNVQMPLDHGKRALPEDDGEAPRFVLPLENGSFSVGAAIELECKLVGTPTPQIKWTKDGTALVSSNGMNVEYLAEAGKCRLTIAKASPKDEGTYRCVASNDHGSATTRAVLSNLDAAAPPSAESGGPLAPRFAIPLSDVRAIEGNPLKLECRVDGQPMPTVTWFKDGEKVEPNERIQLESFPDGTCRLYIPSCLGEDEGTYRVVAENPAGRAHSKGSATVKRHPAQDDTLKERAPVDGAIGGRAPKLVTPFDSQRVKHDDTVFLSCSFSGLPQPSVKIYKDGERLYPFGRHEITEDVVESQVNGLFTVTTTLKIGHVDSYLDAGAYRAVAENDHGSARTLGELTIQASGKQRVPSSLGEDGKAPGFSIPLTMRRVPEGGTVQFECMPYGDPFPLIQWMKDGIAVESTAADSGRQIRIEALEDGTQRLTITGAELTDDGFWRCVAKNEHGTASTKAELMVQADQERLLKRTQQLPDMTLEETKPRFKPGLQNVNVTQGSVVELQAVCVGLPEPQISWFKDGVELKPTGERLMHWKDKFGICRALILNAQPEDEGVYSIKATNVHGTASTQATLGVLKPRVGSDVSPGAETEGDFDTGLGHPPAFLRQLKNKHVFTEFPIVFDCLVRANPAPDVDWYHDGQRIVGDDRRRIFKCRGGSHALVLMRCLPEDMGQYVAIARNTHGTAQSSAILDVTVPLLDTMRLDGEIDMAAVVAHELELKRIPYSSLPTPPDRGPFIKEVTGHYLTLSWIPTKRSPPRYPQVTYVIEIRRLPEKEWTLLDYNVPEPVCKVRNLELGKSYQFRVRAENIYGISDPSPSSPPSQLMAPPRPVLDNLKRPIPLLDPYAIDYLEKRYAEQYACAPYFAPRQEDRVYCAENETIDVVFHACGYPDPKIEWKFRGWDLDTAPTSRFRVKTYGGSETVLSIHGFKKEDAGQYQCFATNPYGEAQQNIFIELAERPSFLAPLSDKLVESGNRQLKLQCRVDGTPYPEIRWMKDYHPLVASGRVVIDFEPPYLCTLTIDDPLWRDSGVYTCVATNPGGRIMSTAAVTVEAETDGGADDIEYVRRKVQLTPRKVREVYVIEEDVEMPDSVHHLLRAAELETGRPLSARRMPMSAVGDLQREVALRDALPPHPNIAVIYDATYDPAADECWLIQQRLEASLLDRMTAEETTDEDQVVMFVRQLLDALDHLHKRKIAHLDIRPETIMLKDSSSPNQIKLTDFGQSRRLRRDKPIYGTVSAPEFVSPEIASGLPVGLQADMWSVGVLAYVLISGVSPFLGDNDAETLSNIKKGAFSFSPDAFKRVSADAQDFLQRLMKVNPKERLTTTEALDHPWICKHKPANGERLSTDHLKEFKYRHKWVERRVFVQQSIDKDDKDKVGIPGVDAKISDLKPDKTPTTNINIADGLSGLTELIDKVLDPLVGLPPKDAKTEEPSLISRFGILRFDNDPGLQVTSRIAERTPDYSRPQRQSDGHPYLPYPSSIDYRVPPTTPDYSPTRPRRDPGLVPASSVGAPSAGLSMDDYRDIEDEIANRILSDISEEESLASMDDLAARALLQQSPLLYPTPGKQPHPKTTTEQRKSRSRSRSGTPKAVTPPPTTTTPTLQVAIAEDDHEESPPGVDISDPAIAAGAPVVIEGLHPMTLIAGRREVPHGGELTIDTELANNPDVLQSPVSPRPTGKSPVRWSPTKEAIMEVVIGMKKGAQHRLESPEKVADRFSPPPELKDHDDKPTSDKAHATTHDNEFDNLMDQISKMKDEYRKRREDILNNGTKSLLGAVPLPEMDVDDYEWESHYQIGPETYLLSIRDPEMSSRVRDYRRELWGDAAAYCEAGELGCTVRDISVRERRRYTDVIREDPAIQKSISVLDCQLKRQAANTRMGALRRVKSDIHVPPPPLGAPPLISIDEDGGHPPIFYQRLKDQAIVEGATVVLQCAVVANPPLSGVNWFQDETAIASDDRHQMVMQNDRCTLTISRCVLSDDAGVYSCVADNDLGQAICSASLTVGDLPERPSRPDVELASDTEVFITWDPPIGGPSANADVQHYRLEYRRAGEGEWNCPWMLISEVIDEEAVIVRHLEPLGIYQFRLTAGNAVGYSEPSLSSRIIRTHQRGAPKLNVDALRKEFRRLNIVTVPPQRSMGDIQEEVENEEASPEPVTTTPTRKMTVHSRPFVTLTDSEPPTNRYQLEQEIFRGRFCTIRNAVDKRSEHAAQCVAKIISSVETTNGDGPNLEAIREFEMLRECQHDNVAELLNAYESTAQRTVCLITERLYEHVYERFTYRDYYTEDQIANTTRQMLAALQWLHFKRVVHLDVRPENVMFSSKRSWTVKLIDFGSAVQLSTDATPTHPYRKIDPEFAAPEVLKGSPVTPAVDVWGVGLVTFILLSGFHPYACDDDTIEEIQQNIINQKCDPNQIYTNASQESLRFVTWALKKMPFRRMPVDEGLVHRWLAYDKPMIRRRENIKYPSNRLRKLAFHYERKRRENDGKSRAIPAIAVRAPPIGGGAGRPTATAV